MNILLKRFISTDKGTFGILTVDDKLFIRMNNG